MTERVAVRAGRAFDGREHVPGGLTVLVEGVRIVGVQPAGHEIPDGWPLQDLPTATLLTGLIDAHVHLCGDSADGALDERLPGFDDETLAAVITEALRQHLAAGVTTVRDLGDRRWAVLERRDRAVAGDGWPTILAAGPPVTSVRGHCWHMGGEVEGGEQITAVVRERAERGVDVVKIMASGGVVTPGTDVLRCQFTLDEMRLAVDQAHAAGLPITAHAHGLAAVEQALEAGVDGVEHCTCMTEQGVRMTEELLQSLVQRETAVCPTLGIIADLVPPAALVALFKRMGVTMEEALALRLRKAGDMYHAGVRLVSGSDGGISNGKPNGILPRSIADLVDGGVPNAAALASATSVAAEACRVGDRKGRLAEGYDADLLLVDGDPLTDITALERVLRVMTQGTWAGQVSDP
ncbi:MAG: amidohydrolase family protein [Actinomycetota bacterium]|nr:amidohydrolase family protein [Actinomycetota bacterium]